VGEPITEIKVRPAKRADVPALVECATSSLVKDQDIGFGIPWSERTFNDPGCFSSAWREPNCVGSVEVYVAESEGRVVGYVTIEHRRGSTELVNIDVPRELQRRGIGQKLVQFVEETARNKDTSAVTLGTSRNAAGVPWKSLSWWEKLGYQIVGEEENAWTRAVGEGVREIRMRKEIDRT
jgi:ribosomal protein S18 acetylase RimI-like enzyme